MRNRIPVFFLPALAIVLITASSTTAQTLATYGNQSISKADFLRAYQKNNAETKPTNESYRNYLDLYIKYKLKVKEAFLEKMDTLPGQIAEAQNFKSQVSGNYMTDQASIDRLVNEAYDRGQKDIHIAHIYVRIPANASAADTLQAWQKISGAYSDLQKGKDFTETVLTWSEDPFVKANHGDIGYISVFSLPYELESLAYGTAPMKFSRIYRSKGGYHIFKNLGERKSWGKMQAGQILLAFPPDGLDFSKREVKQRADSIYDLIQKGGDFKKLAVAVSGDNLTYQTGGDMPEFGVGKYSAEFEEAAFALAKDGDISKPIPTAFGYHIIKRLGRRPFPSEKNKKNLELIRQWVTNDARIEVSKDAMLQKILSTTHFSKKPLDESKLKIFTDSSILNRPVPEGLGINDQTVIFSFPKKNYTAKDWVLYRRELPATIGNGKTTRQLMDLYIKEAAFNYYSEYLEDFDKDFALQYTEFKEGNLLFEVMQQKVWSKAAADSIGLKQYFDNHKDKYWWQPSADAIIFTAGNTVAAENAVRQLKKQGTDWKQIVDSSSGLIQADSGRFEWSQLPMMDKHPAAGELTTFNSNANDNSVTFAHIIKTYDEKSQRSFRDARGFVINDYQAWLEDQWIAELKKKYPVAINLSVLSSLPK